MRIQWNSELDIESLEKRGHWATLENLQDVIPFHLGHYKTTLKSCQENPRSVRSKDLTFATRFIAVYLFLNVKGTRPTTFFDYNSDFGEILEIASNNLKRDG